MDDCFTHVHSFLHPAESWHWACVNRRWHRWWLSRIWPQWLKGGMPGDLLDVAEAHEWTLMRGLLIWAPHVYAQSLYFWQRQALLELLVVERQTSIVNHLRHAWDMSPTFLLHVVQEVACRPDVYFNADFLGYSLEELLPDAEEDVFRVLVTAITARGCVRALLDLWERYAALFVIFTGLIMRTACKYGHIFVLEWMHQNHLDDDDNGSYLMTATLNHQPQVVSWVLDMYYRHAEDVPAKRKALRQCAEWARRMGFMDIFGLLSTDPL